MQKNLQMNGTSWDFCGNSQILGIFSGKLLIFASTKFLRAPNYYVSICTILSRPLPKRDNLERDNIVSYSRPPVGRFFSLFLSSWTSKTLSLMGISHVLGVNTHPKVSRKIYFSSKGEKFPPKAPTEPQANDFFFFFWVVLYLTSGKYNFSETLPNLMKFRG